MQATPTVLSGVNLTVEQREVVEELADIRDCNLSEVWRTALKMLAAEHGLQFPDSPRSRVQ